MPNVLGYVEAVFIFIINVSRLYPIYHARLCLYLLYFICVTYYILLNLMSNVAYLCQTSYVPLDLYSMWPIYT